MGPLLWEIDTVVPQTFKHSITIWSSHPTPGHTPKRRESRASNTYGCLIQNSQKAEERINGWTDDWVRKTWSIRTLEYYSVLKRKGVQTPAATQVSLTDITLDEINPSWKDVILFRVYEARQVVGIRERNRMVVDRDWGNGDGGAPCFLGVDLTRRD